MSWSVKRAPAACRSPVSIDAVFEWPGRSKVFPVDFEVVEPSAAEPVLLPTDFDIVCEPGVGGEGQVAVGWIVGLEAVRCEVEGMAPWVGFQPC